ncbi:zinc finger protein 120-like [Peromyscus eremicus]|uniref:zinc finger protein 120-like n=1 Tax=Peromyscus eremicus TaxID=42410 RepID=UPI0027DD1622|nr:zinc finger protein 120-like [Peromyscus eremicus]
MFLHNFENSVTYDDVHVDFTWEEWTLLDPSQKNLYKEVMIETYRNLTIIGYNWKNHKTEEYPQSSRGDERSLRISILSTWTPRVRIVETKVG